MLLRNVQSIENPSGERLLHLWAQRYAPDLSCVSLLENPLNYHSLIDANTVEGRGLTVSKLTYNLLDLDNQLAWIQTQTLHNYIPNVLDLNEARQVTQFATRVYKKLLQLYQKQQLNLALPTQTGSQLTSVFALSSLLSWGKLTLTEVAYALEPILLVFQEQLIASRDWRALGFMTTHFKFTNRLILSQLTPVEKLLLGSYLKFVEEQVSIPWQRICTAAVSYELHSPILTIVEQMIPVASEVAQTVYQQLVKSFPHYRSRSGWLTDSDVAHSTIRDLNMFQAYLWLCVLEQNLAPVTQELIHLCLMVLRCIGVKWEFAQKSIQLLVDEVSHRLTPEHQAILLPYTQGMQQTFYIMRD